MTNLIITGANGKMGKVIQSIVANRSDCNIVAGVDLNTEDNGHFPIYSSIFDVKEKADAIIDFSNPVLLNDLLSYSEKTSTPLVIATTGYSDEQKKQISDASKKIDAPSGTALMLADAMCEEIDQPMKYEYDRHSKREKRTKNEIGIHAVRGGTIVGEHEIIFAGRDEIITLSHSARSKEIFAVGAVNAAVYMNGKGAGLYDMKELID